MNHESGILSNFDAALSAAVQHGLVDRGIQILCNTTISEIAPISEGFCVLLDGDCPKTWTVAMVLAARGRAPQLDGLNLDKAGVEADEKAIAVDDNSRTINPIFLRSGIAPIGFSSRPLPELKAKRF